MTTPRYALVPVAVEAFLIAITTVAIALRIVSRKLSKATLWWDDWLSIAAYPFAIAISASFLAAGFNGFGFHGGDSTFYQRSFYFGILWYYTGSALIKLSVLCFYYRIFSLSRQVTRTLWITGVFVCLWWLTFMLTSIFMCRPLQWLWKPNVEFTCIDMLAHCIANEITNIIIDLVILVIPLRPLWKLQMEHKQKLALAVVFILGYLNPILSILRLAMTVQLTGMDPDMNYTAVPPALCTSAEVCIAVVSASVPSLTHLFRRLNNSSSTTRKRSSNNSDDKRISSPSETSQHNSNLHSNSRSSLSVSKPKFPGSGAPRYGWYTTTASSGADDDYSREDMAADMEGRIHVVREIDITVHEVDRGSVTSV